MTPTKYLLTVTFSAPERQKVLDDPMAGFEVAISAAFPEHRHIHTVSLSRFATPRDRALDEVLTQLGDADEVIIQPCLVSAGPEWERLKERIPHKHNFKLGLPLLTDEDSVRRCAQAMLPCLPEHGVVFMAHGSRDPLARDCSPLLEQTFAALGRDNVYFANLEGENGLKNLLPRLKEDRLELRPFLFCPRLHKQRDLEQLWLPTLTQAGHTVTCRSVGLCAYPPIRDLYIKRAQKAASTWK